MKKLLSRIVCAVAVAAIAAYGVYTSQKETQVSNLTLANVEVLARYELPEVTIECGETQGACWEEFSDCYITLGMKVPDCIFKGYTFVSCTTPCD